MKQHTQPSPGSKGIPPELFDSISNLPFHNARIQHATLVVECISTAMVDKAYNPSKYLPRVAIKTQKIMENTCIKK